MFRLTVEVLFWLLFETAVALGPAVEVVVLAVAAHPSAIREVELIFLLLYFLLGLGLGILPKDRWLVLLSANFYLIIFFVALLRYGFCFFLYCFRRRVLFQKRHQVWAYQELSTKIVSKTLKLRSTYSSSLASLSSLGDSSTPLRNKNCELSSEGTVKGRTWCWSLWIWKLV